MKSVLVTGGAGYVGSVTVNYLLDKGYKVRVIDNLMYGGESLVNFFNNPNFSFFKGDIRNESDIQNAIEGVSYVIHLAAIVGDPACAKNADLAKETNELASKLLFKKACENKVERFVFSSTCSNYGKMKDPNSFVNEESELSPISLYAETKVNVEKFLLNEKKSSCKPTCLRFATAHGLSLRPRFDLTVNEFAKEVALGRELQIFGEQFWRPYCHVVDLARALTLVLEAPLEKVSHNVFNVGNTNENFSKKMLAEKILKVIPSAKIKYVARNEDPRDYRVSFSKIQTELDFNIVKNVDETINETINVVKNGFFKDPDAAKYKNI